jgi:hypothetical protein
MKRAVLILLMLMCIAGASATSERTTPDLVSGEPIAYTAAKAPCVAMDIDALVTFAYDDLDFNWFRQRKNSIGFMLLEPYYSGAVVELLEPYYHQSPLLEWQQNLPNNPDWNQPYIPPHYQKSIEDYFKNLERSEELPDQDEGFGE